MSTTTEGKPDYGSYSASQAAFQVAKAANDAAANFSTTWVGEIDPEGGETVRNGSVTSSFMNMAASALGASMLSLPYAMTVGGPIPVIAMYCTFAYMAYVSAQAIVEAGIRQRMSSYVTIMGDAYGPAFGIFTEGVLMIALLIAGVSFVCALFDISKRLFPPLAVFPRPVLIVILMATMFPSVLVPSLSVFGPVSTMAIIGCYLQGFAISMEAFKLVSADPALAVTGDKYEWPGLSLFSFHPLGVIYVSPMVCFVFAFHYLITDTLDELDEPSDDNMTSVNMISVLLLFFMYIPLAFGGYMYFGGTAIDSNVLKFMDSDQPGILFCMWVMGGLLWGTYALFLIPLRRRVETLAFGCVADGFLHPQRLLVAAILHSIALVLALALTDLALANAVAGGCIALLMFGFPGMMMLAGELPPYKDQPDPECVMRGQIFKFVGFGLAAMGLFGDQIFGPGVKHPFGVMVNDPVSGSITVVNTTTAAAMEKAASKFVISLGGA